MRWLISIIVDALILYALSYVISGISFSHITSALVASVLLSIVYTIVRPIVVFLTLPVTIVTFGLFLFVINALMLMMTSALMGEAFVIRSFGDALLAAILVAIVQLIVKPLRA